MTAISAWPNLKMEWTGEEMLCHAGDLLIAKCQGGIWASVAPGWTVKPTNATCTKLRVTHLGEAFDYPVPKRYRESLSVISMEEPTVGPDGEPRWQPDGERQRYAARMMKEVEPIKVFLAGCQVMFDRKLKAGEIGPDDEISPTEKEVFDMIAWFDLRQLRLLRKIALAYGEPERELLH